jgi:hypothetical protein
MQIRMSGVSIFIHSFTTYFVPSQVAVSSYSQTVCLSFQKSLAKMIAKDRSVALSVFRVVGSISGEAVVVFISSWDGGTDVASVETLVFEVEVAKVL